MPTAPSARLAARSAARPRDRAQRKRKDPGQVDQGLFFLLRSLTLPARHDLTLPARRYGRFANARTRPSISVTTIALPGDATARPQAVGTAGSGSRHRILPSVRLTAQTAAAILA